MNLPAPATEATRRRIASATERLPLHDTQDFDDASRGFVARTDQRQVRASDGRVVWDLDAYTFLDAPAPKTANPSLWRQGQLLIKDGLFEVVPGIYQVRGFDLSVMTVVEGETGVIVIDPLTCRETAAAAFALYQQHRGERPVTGMIYTHSHLDHFGGVKGIISQEDVDAGPARISPTPPACCSPASRCSCTSGRTKQLLGSTTRGCAQSRTGFTPTTSSSPRSAPGRSVLGSSPMP